MAQTSRWMAVANASAAVVTLIDRARGGVETEHVAF
jgi:hypothetical protein